MTLSAVSNKTWLNVEVTLNSWNRVEYSIASAGTAVHGSTQLNGNSIGIRKRLACTRVSYVNFARNTEGETYRDRAPAIRLRRTRRVVHRHAQGRGAAATKLSSLRDSSGGDEELPAVRALGAWMQVGDKRFDGDDIQRRYESSDFPLQRRLLE